MKSRRSKYAMAEVTAFLPASAACCTVLPRWASLSWLSSEVDRAFSAASISARTWPMRSSSAGARPLPRAAVRVASQTARRFASSAASSE